LLKFFSPTFFCHCFLKKLVPLARDDCATFSAENRVIAADLNFRLLLAVCRFIFLRKKNLGRPSRNNMSLLPHTRDHTSLTSKPEFRA